MVRRPALALLGLAVVAAGGVGFYTLRASGNDGCPRPEDLQWPVIDYVQQPKHYIDVTLNNPNDCFGFDNEPVEITLFAANRRRAISYTGEGPPHEVGVCCNVTLPPHGTWTMRFGSERHSQGQERLTVCNVRVEALKSVGYDVWKRMPDGGSIIGRGSFPPGFDPDRVPSQPHDSTWLVPCESPVPTQSP